MSSLNTNHSRAPPPLHCAVFVILSGCAFLTFNFLLQSVLQPIASRDCNAARRLGTNQRRAKIPWVRLSLSHSLSFPRCPSLPPPPHNSPNTRPPFPPLLPPSPFPHTLPRAWQAPRLCVCRPHRCPPLPAALTAAHATPRHGHGRTAAPAVPRLAQVVVAAVASLQTQTRATGRAEAAGPQPRGLGVTHLRAFACLCVCVVAHRCCFMCDQVCDSAVFNGWGCHICVGAGAR